MFESSLGIGGPSAVAAAPLAEAPIRPRPPETETLRELLDELRSFQPRTGVLEPSVVHREGADQIEQLRLLESIRAAAAAAQMRVALAFARDEGERQLRSGVRAERVGQGIPEQIALARRESPARARNWLSAARGLICDLPQTYAALADGSLSESRACLVARETTHLAKPERVAVDALLAPRVTELGDRQLVAETRTLVYRQDPAGFVARQAAAEADRCVSIRPAPDAMVRLSALLPLKSGVATYAALTQAAESARSQGDPRSRGQVMADTLVERATGLASARAVPVELNVLMPVEALLDPDGSEPAQVPGFGPIPPRSALDESARIWIRRLFTRPSDQRLVAMESSRREFTGALRHFLTLRDQVCRTPWCEAPIRHLDHVIPHAHEGPTEARNGQGLCESCNYARQAAGWFSTMPPEGAGHAVRVHTPTGASYLSRPPAPRGSTTGRLAEPADVDARQRGDHRPVAHPLEAARA